MADKPSDPRGQYYNLPSGVSNAPSPAPSPDSSQLRGSTYSSFSPGVENISPSTPKSPDTQLSQDEKAAEETENRRARLSSNLLEQKHALIRTIGWVITVVIIVMYSIFAGTIGYLFYSERAFSELEITTLVLLGMSGSVPTILSISLLVGLFAKEKDQDKESKSAFDISTIAKACLDIAKVMKATH